MRSGLPDLAASVRMVPVVGYVNVKPLVSGWVNLDMSALGVAFKIIWRSVSELFGF
jgi:hypothetical protein